MGATKVSYFEGKGRQIPTGFNPGPGARVVSQGIYEQSATKKHALGERLQIGNRVFYYALAGAVALIAGQLCESAAYGGSSATIQTNLTVPTVTDGSNAAGQNKVTVTMATDAATLDQFADGYLSVYDGTAAQGVGQTYRIKSNEVATAAGALKLTLYDDLVVVLTAAGAYCNVITNEFYKVLISAANPVGFPIGVPLIAVTATQYAWLQTFGPCACLLGGTTPINGEALTRSTATAGALQVQVAGSGSLTNPEVGFLMHLACADTAYGMVNLKIMV
jgi:hypothetical protein